MRNWLNGRRGIIETGAARRGRFQRARVAIRTADQLSRPTGKARCGGQCQTAGELAVKMPFGKHEGKPLVDVNTGYLRWMLEQGWISRKHPGLLNEVWRVLKSRPGALDRKKG
jgi:uncharacterized protein (DUF3820 family)